jgi:hypothetical protein
MRCPWRLVGLLAAALTDAAAHSPLAMPIHGFRIDERDLVVDLFVGPHMITPTTAAVHMLVLSSPSPHPHSGARRRLMGRRPDAWYAAQAHTQGDTSEPPLQRGASGFNQPAALRKEQVPAPAHLLSEAGKAVEATAAEAVLHLHDGTAITMANGIFEIPIALIGSGASQEDALSMPVTVEWRGKRFPTRVGTWTWQHRERRYTLANSCMVLNIKCGNLLDAATPGRCMKDWIEWHRLLGMEHFFVYDNNSGEGSPFYRALAPYVARGVVTLVDYPVALGGSDPGGGPTQRFQLLHAQLAFMRRAKWMAFFDADEFVVPPAVLLEVPPQLQPQPGGLAGGGGVGGFRFAAAWTLAAMGDAKRAASATGYFGVHSVMHNAQHPDFCEPHLAGLGQQRTVRLSACDVYRSERRGNPKPFLHAGEKPGNALTSPFDLACLSDTKGLPHNAPGCFDGGRARDPLFEGLPFLHFAVNHGCHGKRDVVSTTVGVGGALVPPSGPLSGDHHRRRLADRSPCVLNTSVARSGAVRELESILAAIDACGSDDPACVPAYPEVAGWLEAQAEGATSIDATTTAATTANPPASRPQSSDSSGSRAGKSEALIFLTPVVSGAALSQPPAAAARDSPPPQQPIAQLPQTPTSECLASTTYLGEGRFHWGAAADSRECGGRGLARVGIGKARAGRIGGYAFFWVEAPQCIDSHWAQDHQDSASWRWARRRTIKKHRFFSRHGPKNICMCHRHVNSRSSPPR